MDFFRKLLPLIKRKKMTQDTNKTDHISETDLSLDQNSTQIVSNANAEESMSINNEIYHIPDDDDELGCNKILCTLENVAPIKISPNLTLDESKNIEITDDVPESSVSGVVNNTVPEKTILFNDVTDDTTSNNAIHRNEEIGKVKLSQRTDISNDITHNTVIDDKTLQNLREFEETLDNFDMNACLSNDSAGELIDLNEFNDIFDELDTLHEDLNSQIYSARNDFERNNERSFCSNTNKNNIFEIVAVDSEKIQETLEKIDIISINSSTDDEKNLANGIQETISINSDSQEAENSECEGYNSSDFEFISETEANMDGFIINFRREMNQENDKLSQESSEPLRAFFSEAIEDIVEEENCVDPGEGPSGMNRQKHEFEDRSYRNNHVIPDGDDYLGLFQGIYNPLLPVSEIFFLENKSVRASAMNVLYDGIGFDKQLALRRPPHDSSDDEFEDEAKECAKKILNMYPGENRKRQRRY